MQHVYSFYNTLSQTFLFPLVRDADPKVYAKQLHDVVYLDLAKAKESMRIDECIVYYIGQFDPESGKILFANQDQTGEVIFDGVATCKQLEALKYAATGN